MDDIDEGADGDDWCAVDLFGGGGRIQTQLGDAESATGRRIATPGANLPVPATLGQ